MNPDSLRPFLILILGAVILSGCLPDEARRTALLTEHALNIVLADDASKVLVSHSQGYVSLARFKKLKYREVDQWALENSADAAVLAMDFSKDNRFITTVSQKTIARYAMEQKKVDQYWSLDNISDVKISSNGEFALVASAEEKNDQYGQYVHYRIVYFHLPTGKIKYAFYHDDQISTIDLSDDDRYAITGSDDGKARLWDLLEGKLLYTWSFKSKIFRVRLSSDGRYAMVNNASGVIRVYKTRNGKLYRKLKLTDKVSVSAAVFSADNKYLATALSKEQLLVWHLKSGKMIRRIKPQRRYFWQPSLARITTLAFSGKKKLVSITSRGVAQEWVF